MKIALFANLHKKNSFEVAKQIISFFSENKVEVLAPKEIASDLGVSVLDSQPLEFLITLGGDGSILRLLHHHPKLDNVPIVGINLGHLGFMTSIPLNLLIPSLTDLINKEYRIDERIVIQGHTLEEPACFAVNDIVIHRSKNPSLIDLSIHVDGVYLNTFSADGIIFATPSGSTAYSLAAGGPILTPELKALCVTPISPHTISNRPLVLMPQGKIEIQYLSPYDPVEVTYDGFSRHSLATNDVFTISLSPKKFKLVSLFRTDYFTTLRTKLGWSGQVRYSELNHRTSDWE